MKIKVVTFNLRLNNLHYGINYFFNRAPYILKRIQEEKPDIIGFQEAKEPIYEWLKANLTEYTLVGIGRGKTFKDEANPVAFRKDRFELFSFNQFWLSPTPEIPGSRYEEQSPCPRICCALKLKEKEGTEVIRFYNTHLDHVGEQARLLGIQSILSFMEAEKEKSAHPVILMGDMNAYPYEPSIEAIRNCKAFAWNEASERIKNSFHGFRGGSPYEDGKKIDYIYTDLKYDPASVTAWDECYEGIYLTDHYPISVTLEI